MKLLLRANLIFLAVLSVSLEAADWPHWRGANRSDVVSEPSGWDGNSWRIQEQWRTNVGEGSSSPLVIADALYAMGWLGERDTLVCLDLKSGKVVWKQSYDAPNYGRRSTGDKGIYSGPSSTPEYDAQTGLLFTLSLDGDLIAWDTRKRGAKKWGINLYDTYKVDQRPDVGGKRGGASRRDYGYTTSPLVQGDTLIVEVGARSGTLVGLDKTTGRELWKSQCTDEAGHSGGAVPISVEGVPCVAMLTLRNLLVARLDKGKEGQTVAEFPWTTDFGNNIPTPTVHGSDVLITSAYNKYAICRINVTFNGARKVWEQPHASGVCSPVVHQSRIYWAWRGIHCLDWETGKELWTGGKVGSAGSCVLTADERLVVWSDNGELSLVETAVRSPDKFRELAHIGRLGSSDAWPHVVLANGHLIVRDRQGNLRCFGVGKSATSTPSTVATNSPGPPESTPKRVSRPAKPADLKSWPGDDASVLFAWQAGMGTKAVGHGKTNAFPLKPTEAAEIDESGAMRFRGGAIAVEGADETLLKSCKESGELSIELVFTSDDLRQTGPARIATFSTDGYSRNFTLAQEQDRLVFRLRTPQTGDNGIRPETTLGKVQAGKETHLVVAYRDGELAAYLDGKPILEASNVRGDFSNWNKQHLLFGNEWDGGDVRDWHGTIERVAIFNRFVDAGEAERRAELARE